MPEVCSDVLWTIITIIFAARHLGATVSTGILAVILLWCIAINFTVVGTGAVGWTAAALWVSGGGDPCTAVVVVGGRSDRRCLA